MLIALLASCVLFIVQHLAAGLGAAVMAVGLWGLVAVVAGAHLPAFVQRFRVEPPSRPRSGRTSSATSRPPATAMDLGRRDQQSTTELDRDADNVDLTDNADDRAQHPAARPGRSCRPDLPAARRSCGASTVQRRRRRPLRTIDGAAARRWCWRPATSTPPASPQTSWEGRHLAYTHGYGVVMAAGQRRRRPTADPTSCSRTCRCATDADLELTGPQIYFGEDLGGLRHRRHASRDEIDFQTGERDRVDRYERRRRRRHRLVPAPGRVRAALRRLQPADLELHHRRLEDPLRPRRRATGSQTLAPFLAVRHTTRTRSWSTARVKWIIDAYTTTDRYPYAQTADTGGLPGRQRPRRPLQLRAQLGEGRGRRLRRHGHVLRDRRRGPDHPGLRRGLPGPVHRRRRDARRRSSSTSATPRTCSGCRRNMWGRYHIDDPQTFYNSNDAWNVAQDPGTAGAGAATQTDQRRRRAGGPSTRRPRSTPTTC